ncbi:MAG: glycosyltransferase [Kiritimatiellia bacterium]|jgi:4,4'-diaponeurosporenoate glycosyltransferase|nr:glycosyltransferase [Kiritimatiellia bacterium]
MFWIAACLWAMGFVLIWKIPKCPPATLERTLPSVSIIIPARNEAGTIGQLVSSIRQQSIQPVDLLVVDDGSEDETVRIAEEAGATVLPASPLPVGWRGKTWACQQGAIESHGDVLLFLDADTVLQPDALKRILSVYGESGVQALSLGPYHDVHGAVEQLSGLFNLMTYAGMGAFSLFDSPHHPSGLFGPFLLIDRVAYQQVGGHDRVRGEILEHMVMGQRLIEAGVPVVCMGGREVVHMRMYTDGLRSLIEGWTKAFAFGASRTRTRDLLVSIAWLSGAVMAFMMPLVAALLATPVTWSLMIYALYVLQFLWFLRQIGSFAGWASFLYPVLLLFFFFVFIRSAVRMKTGQTVTWKGRTIPPPQQSVGA